MKLMGLWFEQEIRSNKNPNLRSSSTAGCNNSQAGGDKEHS
jgi:hypothetical protein